MTLLEVIVALTVAGAALATGAAVLGFLTDQQSQTRSQEVIAAHTVRTTVRTWLASAQLTTEGDAEFRGVTDGRGVESNCDEVTFVTFEPTEVSSAGTQVHIHMKQPDRATGNPGLVADLTPWRSSGTPVTLSLSPTAVGFHARYLGSLAGTPHWERSWISTSVLPAAVELRVLFDSSTDARNAAHALLAVPMTISLGARQ